MADQKVDGATDRDAGHTMSPRATFRRLRICGLSAAEAGNLTARLEGLPPVHDGWRVLEIERLVFLRWLVDRGRFADDERPADHDGWLTDNPATAWSRRT
jgi:hypothetical protein